MTKAFALLFSVIFLGTACIAQNTGLDYYLNKAMENSPLLKEYQNQVLANALDSQRIRAAYKPQVSGIGNNTYAPVINGYGYDAVLTNIMSVTDVVNVNKTFAGKRYMDAQYSSLRLATDSVRNAGKIAAQDLKRTVTAQYITAYGDLQQLSFYNEVNELLKNQGDILKKLTQNNIYRQTDYLTFLVTLQQQDLQLRQLRILYRTDYAALNYMCGIFDTAAAALPAPDIALQQLPDATASIFFLRYRTDSMALQNNLSILNYAYRPKLSTFGNAGFSSSFLYQAYKNFGFSVGVDLTVPIYDGHQRRLQQQKIRLLQYSNDNYKDFFRMQYDQQIAMLRQQLTSTEALINDINEQIKYSQGLIDVNGKLMEKGDAKISDFIIAINNYLASKNLLAQNNISRMQIINQLNYWNR